MRFVIDKVITLSAELYATNLTARSHAIYSTPDAVDFEEK